MLQRGPGCKCFLCRIPDRAVLGGHCWNSTERDENAVLDIGKWGVSAITEVPHNALIGKHNDKVGEV